MKKIFALVLSAAVAISALTGCQTAETEDKPRGPLQICVDFGDTPTAYADSATAMENLVSTLELYHKVEGWGPEEIEVEVIPAEGVERDTALARVRTAVMSGEGPDLFIVTCPDPSSTLGALFPYPEKAMLSNYFLPLDDYMKGSQFTDWDKLEPSIMGAGKTEEGQMLLPMAFDLLLTYFHQGEAEGYDGSTRWQDMVDSSDPALSAAAEPAHSGESMHIPYGCSLFPLIFNDYVDYSQESLLFSEEELFEAARSVGKLKLSKEAPDHYSSFVSRLNFNVDVYSERMSWMDGIGFEEDMTMVPIYNREGGATAMVKAYCAINRNTSQPKNAFFAADYFLSESVQAKSSLYSAWNQFHMISNTEYIKSKMREAQAQELSRVLEQISCVRYWTPLDVELADIVHTADFEGWTEEKLRGTVSDTYEKMTMMIAES